MLGISALMQLPIAGFPGGGPGSPAWRRLLAEIEPDAVLNRRPPLDLVWHDPTEEEEAIVLELVRMM